MTPLKLEDLKQIILQSYQDGYSGSLELATDYVDERAKIVMEELSKKDIGGIGWKVYDLEELKKLPVGTIIEHQELGKGWVEGKSARIKEITFESGKSYHLIDYAHPWDVPMREIAKV